MFIFYRKYRVFGERQKRVTQHIFVTTINGWNRNVRPSGMHLIFWRPCILSYQHFWTERFNFSWHLINICLLHSHFCSSVGGFLLVLAALSQNLSFHNGGKYDLSLVKHIHGIRGNILLVFYLFVWVSCKWKNFPFSLTICGRHNEALPLVKSTQTSINQIWSNVMNVLRHYYPLLKKYI